MSQLHPVLVQFAELWLAVLHNVFHDTVEIFAASMVACVRWLDEVDGFELAKKAAPPIPTWTCPHCGHVHTPATLRRLDGDNVQCQGCKRPFPSAPDETSAPAHGDVPLVAVHYVAGVRSGRFSGRWAGRASAGRLSYNLGRSAQACMQILGICESAVSAMARGCRLCSDVRRADCGGCQWPDAAAGIWGLALLQRRVQLGFVPNMTIFDTDNHWIIETWWCPVLWIRSS